MPTSNFAYEGNLSQSISSVPAAELTTVNLYTKKLAIQPSFDFKIFQEDFYINTHGVSVTELPKSTTALADGLFYILNKNNQAMVFNSVTLASVKFRNESAIPGNTLKHVFINTAYNSAKTHAYDNYDIIFRSNVVGRLVISRSIKHLNNLNFMLNPFQSIEFGATYAVQNLNMLDMQYYGASNINKNKKVGTIDMILSIKSFSDVEMTKPIYDTLTLTVNVVNSGYIPAAVIQTANPS